MDLRFKRFLPDNGQERGLIVSSRTVGFDIDDTSSCLVASGYQKIDEVLLEAIIAFLSGCGTLLERADRCGEGVVFAVQKSALKLYRDAFHPDQAAAWQSEFCARVRALIKLSAVLPSGVVVPSGLLKIRLEHDGVRENEVVIGHVSPYLERAVQLLKLDCLSGRQEAHISKNTIVSIFRELHGIIEALHALNIVICDLKLSNLLLYDGKIKLIDNVGMSLPGFPSRLHTPLSTDPAHLIWKDQKLGLAAGVKLDKLGDWWAYRCMLYQCLTNCRPYQGVVWNSDGLASSSTINSLEEERIGKRVSSMDLGMTPPAQAIPEALGTALYEDLHRAFKDGIRERFNLHLLDGLDYVECPGCKEEFLSSEDDCPICSETRLVDLRRRICVCEKGYTKGLK